MEEILAFAFLQAIRNQLMQPEAVQVNLDVNNNERTINDDPNNNQ